MREFLLFRPIYSLFVVAIAVVLAAGTARADEVTDWNAVLIRAIQTAATPGPLQGRVGAIVHVAIFDAYNGVERRYTPIRVRTEAPRGASRRAAVVAAAYTALATLFPAQSFTADYQASLAKIADDDAIENSTSIERGLEWGQQVAQEILTWRSTDGLDTSPSTFNGSLDVGKWRPTPRPDPNNPGSELAGLNALVPSLATTAPFVIPSPSSFRSTVGPPALTSAQYAADVNEVKSVGEATSTTRTADQTQSARFWAGTAVTFWNRAATAAADARHNSLSENARLFALLNVAIADALISCWDAKFQFLLWRPITAIRLANTDGNPATDVQATWTPLITTPPYPEYDSGHQSVSGSAQAILTATFGSMPVQGVSESLPGVTRSWPSFAAAAEDALMARIWSGIHFRTAMEDTRVRAARIAAYVLEHAAVRVNGR
jgi:hypothetical protein